MLFTKKKKKNKKSKDTHRKKRQVYLSYNTKCFHKNVKVCLDNMTYNMHFILFKKSSNDEGMATHD